MDMSLAASPLADQLARGIEAVGRIRVETALPRGYLRQKHLDRVVATARAAMASGESAAMRAAMSSVDFLALELCDD